MGNEFTKFDFFSFRRSRDILGGLRILKLIMYRDHAPFRGCLSSEAGT